MNLINFIIIILIIIPVIGVITDFKQGKIKNYFIFPCLICLIILTFFIEGFYIEKNNIIQLLIIILFGYIFYINNKWGAGDGKYLIILGLSSIIIGYLKGYENIILTLFGFSFFIIFISILFYIFINIKSIINNIDYKINQNIINIFFNFNIIFIVGILITIYLKTNYNFLIIFGLMYIILPIIDKININKILKILFILINILILYLLNYLTIWYIYGFIIFFCFIYLAGIIEKLFNIIDIKEIKIIDIKQGDILTTDSIKEIKNKINIELQESPLQGLDVYNIIKAYKKNDINKKITIYKDIKIGIHLYIGFLINIIYYYFLK